MRTLACPRGALGCVTCSPVPVYYRGPASLLIHARGPACRTGCPFFSLPGACYSAPCAVHL